MSQSKIRWPLRWTLLLQDYQGDEEKNDQELFQGCTPSVGVHTGIMRYGLSAHFFIMAHERRIKTGGLIEKGGG